MRLFNRLNANIYYNNLYSIRRAIVILDSEFILAIKNNDANYAREVLDTTQKIYDNFINMCRESNNYNKTTNYMQKLWASRLIRFIDYLAARLKDNFGVRNVASIAKI